MAKAMELVRQTLIASEQMKKRTVTVLPRANPVCGHRFLILMNGCNNGILVSEKRIYTES
jgi:hypothetical protein